MTMPSQDAYDPVVHLNKEDVAVDNPAAPSIIRITIKQSKTDPFGKGIISSFKNIVGPLPSICHHQLPAGKGVAKRPLVSTEGHKVSNGGSVWSWKFVAHFKKQGLTRISTVATV